MQAEGARPVLETLDPEAVLLDPEFARDPYPLYAVLLERHRVYWSPTLQYWFVSGYEEIKGILMAPGRFSSEGWDQIYLAQLPLGNQAELETLQAHFSFPSLVAADPPQHTRLRRLVHRAFTPRAVERLRDAIYATVSQLLDNAEDAGSFDVVGDLAIPLPITVFAHTFGIPPDHHQMLKTTSADFTRFVSNVRPNWEDALQSDRSLGEFRAYLLELLQERRRQPLDDLATILVSTDDQGDALSDDELLSLCAHLLIAGHETTTNLIANGMLALLTHPSQLAALRKDQEYQAAAIEEMLRWQTPLQRVKRIATESALVGEARIEAGQRLMLLIGAANRDPQIFDEPESFDFTRARPPHLALGHGIHFCVGAALARLEAEIAFAAVIDRYPELRLPPDWKPTWNPSLLRGLTALPVEYT
jgi:pimeloyl-[acyl-carrier protein] synthase